MLEFASNIYHKDKNSLEEAKKDQYKTLKKLKDLEEYNSKNLDRINWNLLIFYWKQNTAFIWEGVKI